MNKTMFTLMAVALPFCSFGEVVRTNVYERVLLRSVAVGDGSLTVVSVRQALAGAVEDVSGLKDPAGVISEYDIPDPCSANYRMLAGVVSNQYQNVMNEFELCATNRLERLLILGVRDRFGEDFYIDYLSAVANLCVSNRIEKRELVWTMAAQNSGMNQCLFRRYSEQPVRSLIEKIMTIDAETNYWSRVLSGEMYRQLQDEGEFFPH